MNTKNEIPKLEDMRVGDIYAFTISPDDSRQYREDIDRLPKSINLIKTTLKSLSFEYKLYIELSPTGRIHGHGWIWINDPFSFLMYDVHTITKHNTICIKPIDDGDKWVDYCTKQSHVAKGLAYSTFDKKSRCLIHRFHPLLSDGRVLTTLDEFGVNFVNLARRDNSDNA